MPKLKLLILHACLPFPKIFGQYSACTWCSSSFSKCSLSNNSYLRNNGNQRSGQIIWNIDWAKWPVFRLSDVCLHHLIFDFKRAWMKKVIYKMRKQPQKRILLSYWKAFSQSINTMQEFSFFQYSFSFQMNSNIAFLIWRICNLETLRNNI